MEINEILVMCLYVFIMGSLLTWLIFHRALEQTTQAVTSCRILSYKTVGNTSCSVHIILHPLHIPEIFAFRTQALQMF